MTIFTIFGLPVYLYGAVLAVTAAAALFWTARNARAHGDTEAVSWMAVLSVPLGLIFGRAGYLLARWEWASQQDLSTYFRVTDGGLMLYGALAGVVLAAWLAAKLAHASFPALLDDMAAPGAMTIAVMRLAEGPLGLGFGWSVADWFDPEMGMSVFALEDVSFLQRFPFAVLDYCEDWVWAVFVLEALIAVGIMIVLLRTKASQPGRRALLFLLLYACTQVLGESMRQDDVLKWGFVRVNQILGGLAAAGVLLYCCVRAARRASVSARRIALSWAGLLASAGLVIAAEFMLEKKIVFLEFVPMDMCHVIMALACAGMIASVLPMWRRAMTAEA